jgi:uncharacterized OsmC-like protein
MARAIKGIDKDRWQEIKEIAKANPKSAMHTLRARSEWMGNARTRTVISTGQGRSFEVLGDEPPSLLGEGTAPKAMEYILHALGSCLAVGLAYNASSRGMELQSVQVDLEGDVDLRGFLGVSDEVRPGYREVRLRCKVIAKAPREEIEELWEEALKTSPVMDIISNGVDVYAVLEG